MQTPSSIDYDARQLLTTERAETPSSSIMSRFPIALKSPRSVVSPEPDTCYDVETLEKIFAEFSNTHITYIDYFNNRETGTGIP